MKILFVSNCAPWSLDSGMYQRVYNIIKALVRRHDVTLVAPLAKQQPASRSAEALYVRARCQQIIEVDTKAATLRSIQRFHHWAPFERRLAAFITSALPGAVRQWMTNDLAELLSEIRRRERFDLVWAERLSMAEIARGAGFKKIVVDIDDMESVALKRLLKNSPWYGSKPLHYAELVKLSFYEQSLPHRFWRLIVCKEEDRQLFGRNPESVFIVPNGVTSYSEAPRGCEYPGRILFVGTLSYQPNVDALHFFYRCIFPRIREVYPDCHLAVVGKEPEAPILGLHNGIDCIVYGQVSDVSPYFSDAALVVAPIRLGSGTRIKVLEALVHGKAVVATPTAVEGLDLRSGIDLEIADTPEGFAVACGRLLNDADERHRLGISGRQRVLELYTWDAIAEQVERVITTDATCAQASISERAV